jgi:Protein of unknown function (DUF1684)/SnoaL-like domain
MEANPAMVLSAHDEHEIRALVARYLDAVSRFDATALAATWAIDGQWHVGPRTVKGADLGGSDAAIIIDLNFLYHPSSLYNPSWVSPLAPPGNITTVPVHAGEMLTATPPDLADG